jgi:hypothetical protein
VNLLGRVGRNQEENYLGFKLLVESVQNLVNKARTGVLIDWNLKYHFQVLIKEKLYEIRAHHAYLPCKSRKCLAQAMGSSKE